MKNLKPGLYRCIGGSPCCTLQRGDIFRISKNMNLELGGVGWLLTGEWEDLNADVEPYGLDLVNEGAGI